MPDRNTLEYQIGELIKDMECDARILRQKEKVALGPGPGADEFFRGRYGGQADELENRIIIFRRILEHHERTATDGN